MPPHSLTSQLLGDLNLGHALIAESRSRNIAARRSGSNPDACFLPDLLFASA